MILSHPTKKPFSDFPRDNLYRIKTIDGPLMMADQELKVGQIIILKEIKTFALIVDNIWEVNGQKIFSYKSAEGHVVRGVMTYEDK